MLPIIYTYPQYFREASTKGTETVNHTHQSTLCYHRLSSFNNYTHSAVTTIQSLISEDRTSGVSFQLYYTGYISSFYVLCVQHLLLGNRNG